jgi:hypothetical protein
MKILMRWCDREPTLKEMLSDSVIRDVMEADGVDPQELAAMLSAIGEELRRGARRAAPFAKAVAAV